MKKKIVKAAVGKVAVSLTESIRRVTARWRCLPDTIILGAQKSGTSSLFAYLAQHPDVLTSFRKEVHFFDGGLRETEDNFSKGSHWYRSHFPLAKELTEKTRVLEASPLYLFHPLVPERIHELIPDVRMLVVLRDPVERAVSNYFHEVRAGREVRPIMIALQEEEKTLEHVWAGRNYKLLEFHTYSYKTRGIYVEQLKRYFEYFPREQLLVLESRMLFANPDLALQPVWTFLDLDSSRGIKDKAAKNVNPDKRIVSDEVMEYLRAYYRPYNEQLFDLLRTRFEWV